MGIKQSYVLLGVTCVAVLCLCIGVLIGWYSLPDKFCVNPAQPTVGIPENIMQNLSEIIDNEVIDDTLRFLTMDPHVSGSHSEYVIAQYIRDKFIEYGLDSSEMSPYNILLSSPSTNSEETNLVQILSHDISQPDGYRIAFQSTVYEPVLDEESLGKDIPSAFNAYSPSGTVEGDLVYANYAALEDFQHLLNDKEINITDKIVIARYGKIYSGDKAKLAAKFGAKGLILYSDPADYSVVGGAVYPQGIYLPSHGIQRGSLLQVIGDPLTPHFPANEGAYRHSEEYAEQHSLPKLPVHPISSDDAEKFLVYLGGDPVEDDWKGNIPNLIYRYGPGFAPPEQDGAVRMKIHNENGRTDTWNVIGKLFGAVEPDRFIVIGSHSDAWAFGAIDPSTGLSTMLEVARAFGELKKNGWRPRRSILFASWGASEFGQIGSNEWVEEHSKILHSSAIAYMNIDIAVSGNFVPEFSSTPNLYHIILEAAKQVPDPNPQEFEESVKTVYDRWRIRGKLSNDEPTIGNIASGSDVSPFLQISGVPVLDFSFVHDKESEPIDPFPMYHSIYDTYNLFQSYYDPQCSYLQASARLFAEIARVLADSEVIPFKCIDYANKIEEYYRQLRFGDMGLKMLSEGGLTFDNMYEAVAQLETQATSMDGYIEERLNYNDVLAVRSINDMLMNFERSFLNPQGLPGRPAIRYYLEETCVERIRHRFAFMSFRTGVSFILGIWNVRKKVKDPRNPSTTLDCLSKPPRKNWNVLWTRFHIGEKMNYCHV